MKRLGMLSCAVALVLAGNGFALLEKKEDFLRNEVVIGSYDEAWSLRKVLRRFLWHDRIHAKAMYRMAMKTFGEESVPDVFQFMA